MNAYKEVQNALLEIKGGNYSKNLGICSNVNRLLSVVWDIPGEVLACWRSTSEEAFKDWPKFSGCTTYPVPCKYLRPVDAYDNLYKWSKDSQYGRDRWELLEHLIEWYGKKAEVVEA